MWKSISELLSLIFTVNEKFKHQDKRTDDCERQLSELSKRVNQLTVDLVRSAEREQTRERLFLQALENERLKREIEQLKHARALPAAKDESEP